MDSENSLAVSLFGEILALDQLVRARLAKVLPKGMELSHFSVLNQLSHTKIERTPAQIAKSFRVTRGAITNTLNKLELSGYIHIRPDWDDARRKMVSISPAGIVARNNALAAVTPIINQLISEMGEERLRAIVPILRDLRQKFE
ncbi:MAG: MarR family winged helix-turn-helix transcriptional regulator [Paracoccaceae bacterium]|uniref:MarR family winged helix-turn-helix transcriptional regulator n=1 Tax=Candidatus Salinivivens marinus TaxID=3381703 RepID=UPI000B6DCAF9|nr:MarR family transcriptional regulator [Marinovum sp.]OUU12127.1 MAG: MarR family transcriptional regulator [Rhodobacteraceae bacterium TMED38]PDH60517.1 MAG: MarR family transcriptional regulator [Rhodobacteraceae bacterium MED-G08]|tara:strand:+ start:754 stop:1185 length:432 start_codon:yes stop_codon:yes gene_type:complete